MIDPGLEPGTHLLRVSDFAILAVYMGVYYCDTAIYGVFFVYNEHIFTLEFSASRRVAVNILPQFPLR